ncbi:inorganic triphosphatase [Paraferrimonas sedimenticola]|uniref:Adenylate cyclase n=1 Tax=Paraferrimonas sedimenticola TaxID=375674 RepID=A0AA37W110_9GAMM|nr:CYTH domain-containing protein [Paraferrimonas sedimenticola]GLP95682.1 adenylate cyclase [Paraferrimonas sedimenticola]
MSQTEVELKLLVKPEHANELNQIAPRLGQLQQQTRQHLRNTYFDTPELQLRRWNMGLRVRKGPDFCEQTLKTAGQVQGGLHSRPEYNVSIEQNIPNLSLFPDEIWPADSQLETVQSELTALFSTDFDRQLWLLEAEQQQIEMCLDQGEIQAQTATSPISELELELVDGEPSILFDIAMQIAECIPVRLGRESKAKRGYQMAAQASDALLNDLDYIQLNPELSPAKAFQTLLMAGLERWQTLELMLESNPSPSLWHHLRVSLRMIRLVMKQFNQLTDAFENAFAQLEKHLGFVDQAAAIEQALGINSRSLRKVADADAINQVLEARLEALGLSQKLSQITSELSYGQLQLHLLQLASMGEIHTDTQDLRDHATRFQAESWQMVQQLMPVNTDLDKQDYLEFAAPLEKSLLVGVSYGELYGHAGRDDFRLPWNDMAAGIAELACYQEIRGAAAQLEIDIESWLARKEDSLVFAMEQSRRNALLQTPYWQ